EIGVDKFFLEIGAVRHKRLKVTAENIVDIAQLGRIDIENADIGAHARRDLASRGAGHAGAKDHNLGWAPPRGPAGENPAPAVLRLETPCAHLNREPAGDLA